MEKMEDMLIVWIRDMIHKKFPLTTDIIREQAKHFREYRWNINIRVIRGFSYSWSFSGPNYPRIRRVSCIRKIALWTPYCFIRFRSGSLNCDERYGGLLRDIKLCTRTSLKQFLLDFAVNQFNSKLNLIARFRILSTFFMSVASRAS